MLQAGNLGSKTVFLNVGTGLGDAGSTTGVARRQRRKRAGDGSYGVDAAHDLLHGVLRLEGVDEDGGVAVVRVVAQGVRDEDVYGAAVGVQMVRQSFAHALGGGRVGEDRHGGLT